MFSACADLVAVTGDSGANTSHQEGECPLSSPCSGVDDSGTESGEDFRLLSPEILAEVQNALTRLEAALPGLDPTRREALVRLVNRLQLCLKLQPSPSQVPAPHLATHPNSPPVPKPLPQPPVKRYANRRKRQQRHTVGVSQEELADARRWLQETQTPLTPLVPQEISSSTHLTTNLKGKELKVSSSVFCPVEPPNPNQSKVSSYDLTSQISELSDNNQVLNQEPALLTTPISYTTFPCEIPKNDSGSSLLEYDPSLALFTPAQSVQIAIHKAAINKQLTEETNKRQTENYDSEDDDGYNVEENTSPVNGQVLEDAISSAQLLLQIASDKKNPTPSRFHDRNSKHQKMKRANTIDIPKLSFYDVEKMESDSYGYSKDDSNRFSTKKGVDNKISQPEFIPKTESDKKFLAFLQQANKNDGAIVTYNPSARGGQHWTSRFENLKTAFETNQETKLNPPVKCTPPPITQTWDSCVNKATDSPSLQNIVRNRTPQPLHNKSPWSVKESEESVVIGSLTVKAAPGPVNKFNHAPKSAFQPIEKKPLSSMPRQVQPRPIRVQNPPIQSHINMFKNCNTFTDSNNLSENKCSYQPVKGSVKTSASGSVKKLAAQKFSNENVSSKPFVKLYPIIKDDEGFNSVQHNKLKGIVKQAPKAKWNNTPTPPAADHHKFKVSTFSPYFDNKEANPNTEKIIKIPQNLPKQDHNDGIDYSPPKQYINSPPLSRQYSEPFDYSKEKNVTKSPPCNSKYQNNIELQDSDLDKNGVAYYSQQPAFVQHSVYTQNVPPLSEQESNVTLQNLNEPQHLPHVQPGAQCQTQFVKLEKPTNYHMYSDRNQIVQTGDTIQIGGESAANHHNFEKELSRHEFSEESLVPNPLVLGNIFKVSPTPSEPGPNEFIINQELYELQPKYINYEVPNVLVAPGMLDNQYDKKYSQEGLISSELGDSSLLIKQHLSIPKYEYRQDMSNVKSSKPKYHYDECTPSSGAPSPHWYSNDVEESISEGAEMQAAVTKVMGQDQCQKAVTISNRTQHRFGDLESNSLLKTLLKSPNSPTNVSQIKSSEKTPVFKDPHQISRSPLENKSSKLKLFSTEVSPRLVGTPQLCLPQRPQKIPVSTAASAFRPLVNNLSKVPEADVYRHPPFPPPFPMNNKKSNTENKICNQPTSRSSISNTQFHSHKAYESELQRYKCVSPCRSPPSSSPSFPSVLQKSESWHQLVRGQMTQGRHPPPKSPRLTKTKSSHMLAFPKQYEAHLTPDLLAVKQTTVDQYLKPSSKQPIEKKTKQSTNQKKIITVTQLDENLDNVDEAFETLFQEVAKRK